MPEKPTKVLPHAARNRGLKAFLDRYDPKIVIVSGEASGTQFSLDQEAQTLGRGPGVDLVFDEPSMSRRHAAIEYGDGRFRVRDLGSTNGVLVNGRAVQVADLDHGDRLEIGGAVFEFLVDERDESPPVYELPPED